jgi:hypothetical protein
METEETGESEWRCHLGSWTRKVMDSDMDMNSLTSENPHLYAGLEFSSLDFRLDVPFFQKSILFPIPYLARAPSPSTLIPLPRNCLLLS